MSKDVADMSLVEKADALRDLRRKLINNMTEQERLLMAESEDLWRKVDRYEEARHNLYRLFQEGE